MKWVLFIGTYLQLIEIGALCIILRRVFRKASFTSLSISRLQSVSGIAVCQSVPSGLASKTWTQTMSNDIKIINFVCFMAALFNQNIIVATFNTFVVATEALEKNYVRYKTAF